MNDQEILIGLFKYFGKFVPKEVLKKMFVKGANKEPGYDQIASEMLAVTDDCVIEGIDAFVFSANEAFVSKKVKNSSGTVLYVEYGAFSYSPNTAHGVQEKLAVHVAFPYSSGNNDNLSETLIMNRMHNTLCSILDRMETDQKNLDFCGNTRLINFPAEIVAIEPSLFYDRTGWMALFDFSTTNLL